MSRCWNRTEWTADMDAEIRDGFDAGDTQTAVAAALGLSSRLVANRAKALGIRWGAAGRSRVDLDLRVRVLALVGAGCDTGTAVARVLGVSQVRGCQLVRELVGSGLLTRAGVGRWTRLGVAA